MGQAYCIHEKKKVDVKDGQIIWYKNGVPAEKGFCTSCGCKVVRMLSREERLALKEKQVEIPNVEAKKLDA